MAVFETYRQLRQAEDVQDEIYNISPIDNPVASMSRTIQATGKLHQWTEDQLQAVVKNAKLEGAEAGPDISQPVVELDNPTQIMDKVAEISGTLEEVDKYGRDSEMAYQLELRYGELANDEETAIAGNPENGGRQTKVVPNDNLTAREFASIYAQVAAGNIVDGTLYTTTEDLEAGVLQAHLATYNEGGNPGYLVTDPLTAGYVSSFALAAGRERDINNERRLVNVIDLNTYGVAA